MIAAARDGSKGGLVKLAKGRDKIRIGGLDGKAPVWPCGRITGAGGDPSLQTCR